MKQYIFFLLLLFSVSGCSFLRGGDDLAPADSYESEEDFDEEGSEVVGGEDFDIIEDEEDGDFEGGEEFAGDEEFEDREEEKRPGGLRGFFSRLFGSSEDDDEMEDLEEESDFEGEDEDFAEGNRDYEDYEEVVEEETEEVASEEGREEHVSSAPPEQETAAQKEPSKEKATVSAGTAVVPESKPAVVSLNKIISVPYKKAGHLVNAVYIARHDDTMENISQKIYGMNRVEDLKQINPHLQSRSVKVGDKVYYNSPSRKEDSSRLLFYYQDINAPSSFYTLSPGDNIREVSYQLLGHPNSWKEIWATNPELQSKAEVTRSLNIVYWPKASAVAKAPVPEAAPMEEASAPENAPSGENDSEDIALADPEQGFTPPPVVDSQEGQLQSPQKRKIATNIFQSLLNQKEALLVLIGIIVVLILMIRLFFKKRRQKDFDYTATDIEV